MLVTLSKIGYGMKVWDPPYDRETQLSALSKWCELRCELRSEPKGVSNDRGANTCRTISRHLQYSFIPVGSAFHHIIRGHRNTSLTGSWLANSLLKQANPSHYQ